MGFKKASFIAGGIALGTVLKKYLGKNKDFQITEIKDGKGPALIFINGFLSQKEENCKDWVELVSEKYPDNPYYYVKWESGSLYEMGKLIGLGVEKAFLPKIVKLVGLAGKKSPGIKKTYPLYWTRLITELIANPWHVSVVNAQKTGKTLADIILKTDYPDGYILMGHSLGARVIFYLLLALHQKGTDPSPVKEVYFFGGAVGRKKSKKWEKAVNTVEGKIINYYSENDTVLKVLYSTAQALTSKPIGLGEIELHHKRIINKNVSAIVKGHMSYKESLKNHLDP
jgi:hypothetical protein